MEGYREREQQLVDALERWQAVERPAPGKESPAFSDYVLLAESCIENWTAATVVSPSELNAWIRCRLDFIQAMGRAWPLLCGDNLGTVIQVYREAHDLAVNFRKDDSSMPRIPEYALDPVIGLQSLRDWCTESIRRSDPVKAPTAGLKWQKAQKRMQILCKQGKLPQTLRQAAKLLASEGFGYDTVRTAAHKSWALRAHFKLGTATDDPNGTTNSNLDDLAQQSDRRTQQAIRSMSPPERAKAEKQLKEMPTSNALELVKTMAHDPDAGRTADVAYIEEVDQDHRDDE